MFYLSLICLLFLPFVVTSYMTENCQNLKFNWTQYHRLQHIYKWLDCLSANHTASVTSYTIGKSYEGREIRAIKISQKPGNKAIFIEAQIHAVEWISSAAGSCFINNLLNSADAQMKHLALNYDWIFVPVLNPDGFEYTHPKQRFWRKNRRPNGFRNSTQLCYGVDLNRNFDYMWKTAGYNNDVPCDHWYAGVTPNSEPEVQALQTFVKSFPKHYIRMYLALHSYGNYILLPYGHSTVKFPPNYEQMMRIAGGFARGARKKYGTNFRYGASGLLNYSVSGASKDWAYAVLKIPFTATIELRGSGAPGIDGFSLPASQILEVCAEISDGFVGMLKAAEAENLF